MQTYPTISIIGGGNMGSCLVGGLLRHGHPANKIIIAETKAQLRANLQEKWGVTTTALLQEVVKANLLVLAVKPQAAKVVVKALARLISPHSALLISIAAGITCEQLQRWLENPTMPIIRAMPNTPALLGYGMTGLYANAAVSPSQREAGEALLKAVGETVWIAEEPLMDVVTALSGSGPAYFFYMIEGLINGAIALGLAPNIARKLTLNTALGSAQMALQSSGDIRDLRKNVTSPGGTTEEGIKILKDGKLERLLAETLQAAAKRGKTLSEQND